MRAGYTFFTHSDIVELGRDECNTPIHGLSYFVIAETKSGRRLVHSYRFCSHERVEVRDPEAEINHFFRDRTKDAVAAVEHLLARIVARGTINPEHWSETYPAYGSEAYAQDEALGLTKAWERDRDEDDRLAA